MPTVNFNPARSSAPVGLFDFLEFLLSNADDIEDETLPDNQASFSFGLVFYVVTFADASKQFVEDIEISFNGNPFAEINDVGLSVADIDAALGAESSESDLAAIENLWLELDWEYIGNDNDDILFDNVNFGDEVPINLKGDDTVILNGGDDDFFLGDGDDYAEGGSGNDTILGGKGADILKGGLGEDLLIGGAGKDTIKGGAGADQLEGRNGADKLNGGADYDIATYSNETGSQGILVKMAAGTVIDTYGKTDTIKNIEEIRGSVNADKMIGDSGDNVFRGGEGDDVLKGKGGADDLSGDAGDDIIKGGKGIDILAGGDGDDTLKGGKGSDTITGGAGDDTMTGGKGADTFIFGADSGDDIIQDFDIEVDILTFSEGVSASEQIGDDALITHGNSTVLLLDVDAADLF